MRYPARFCSDVPSVFSVGGVQPIVAEPVAIAVTVIEKAAREAVALPSLTVITMPDVVPAWLAVGEPESLPSDGLKVAQAGLLAMVKLSVSPSPSDAAGVKLYAVSAFALVGGTPEMVG